MKFLKTLLFAIGLSTLSSFAQDVPVDELPTATMDDHYIITLPTDIPLTEYYVADISHFAFASEEEGQKLLNIYARGNLVSCDLHLDEGYVIIRIYTEYMGGDEDLVKLQNYLSNHLTQFVE